MIKKIGFLFIAGVLLLSLVSVNGCGSTTSTSSSSTPEETIAKGIATSSKAANGVDSTATDKVTELSISSVKASSTIPTYSGGFWSFSYTDPTSGVAVSYQVKVYNLSNTEVTTLSALMALTSSDISRLDLYLVGTSSATDPAYTYKVGTGTTSSTLMIITGVNTTTNEVANGPVYYEESSASLNYSYNFTLTYVNMNLNGTYPSGTENFTGSYTEAGTTTSVAGYVEYDGTATAKVVFTSPSAGTYHVNLDTGAVTAASI